MPDKKIRAVLFDFGETVVNFGRVRALGLFWKGSRQVHDYLVEHNQYSGKLFFFCLHNLLVLHKNLFKSMLTGSDFDAMKVMKSAASKKGVKMSEEQWQEMIWLLYEPLSKYGSTEPDLKETLIKLRSMGLKLGIVSNTFVSSVCLDKHMQQIGVYNLFDDILYSYECDCRKPDPRIFLHAADRIGVRMPNIMFVGDRLDNDVKPALFLGMYAVFKKTYNNKSKKAPKGAYRIKRLRELPALIEKIESEN